VWITYNWSDSIGCSVLRDKRYILLPRRFPTSEHSKSIRLRSEQVSRAQLNFRLDRMQYYFGVSCTKEYLIWDITL
jgi:hypothetical protein